MSKQRAVSPHEITLADCQIHLKSAGGAITPKCKTFLFFSPPRKLPPCVEMASYKEWVMFYGRLMHMLTVDIHKHAKGHFRVNLPCILFHFCCKYRVPCRHVEDMRTLHKESQTTPIGTLSLSLCDHSSTAVPEKYMLAKIPLCVCVWTWHQSSAAGYVTRR